MVETDSLGFIIGQQLDKEHLQKEYEALAAILEEKAVTTVFQPIIDLTKVEVIGYEVFVRGPVDSPLHLPVKLFSAAGRFNLSNQLENLCREIAFKTAAANNITEKLFVNIDPCATILHFPGSLGRGWTALGQAPSSVILEIDQQRIAESSGFILERTMDFFKQGIPLAIDKVGSGFSSLESIANMRPQYIKIDRLLVHNLNANQYHSQMIASMVDYAHSIGVQVIAQGVETAPELTAVLSLGVDCAQGYLFAKPSPVPEKLSPANCDLIRECKTKRNDRHPPETILSVPVGDIIEYCPAIEPRDLVSGAELILNSEKVEGVVVTTNNIPVGLLMKNKLYFRLGTKYGVSLYHNRPVELIMDKNPLVVDAGLPLDTVSHLAMGRAVDSKYDFIIVTQNDQYAGIVSITHLLNNVTNLQVRCATNANPLTGLPGNLLIDQKLKSMVEKNQPFAMLYVDLDNFKAFNDKYGFEHGDKALLLTADILRSCVDRICRQDAFLGHIGGDDFVIITHPEKMDELCTAIIRHFDAEIVNLYDPKDLELGVIIARNRRGRLERFPIMTISIGVAHTLFRNFSNYLEIGGIAAPLKNKAKDTKGSTYVIDQRKNH